MADDKDDDMPDFSGRAERRRPRPPRPLRPTRSTRSSPANTLSKIAKHAYGDANAWKRIFDANTGVLKDPNKIFPGQKLKIPAKA
jgi:hypothetical protein